MSDKPQKLPDPTSKIEFIENHRPALPSGDYVITVTQSIDAKRKASSLVDESFRSQNREFSVRGPRFTLDPQLIRAVFPPAGNLGEHSSVLPHISFNRSALPWERFITPLTASEKSAFEKSAPKRTAAEADLANTPKLKTPWLALLLFDQEELVEKKAADDTKTFVESEVTNGKASGSKTCKLNKTGKMWTLAPAPKDGFYSPEFTHESGQQEGDPVTVIDVAADLLEAVLPSLEDVQLLGHVRQPTDDLGTPIGEEVAALIANRLPCPKKMSVVHLVSLEGKYGPDGTDIWTLLEALRNSGAMPKNTFVRLVSLLSWRFTCLGEEHSFKGLLKGLDRRTDPTDSDDYSGTLRLPSAGLNRSRRFVERGHVPMPHEMRQGNRTVSWYHGPLAPGRTGYALDLISVDQVADFPTARKYTVVVARDSQQKLHFRIFGANGKMLGEGTEEDLSGLLDQRLEDLKDLPEKFWIEEDLDDPNKPPKEELAESEKDEIVKSVFSVLNLTLPAEPEHSMSPRSADQLVRYNPENGMFDVSYAAAWELGRLLTLQNEKVAVSLLDWKRRHRYAEERLKAMKALEHLPVVGRPVAPGLPDDVARWFEDLSLLRGVPFNYLVPDERMLPQESIRFFWLDPEWIRCLHDGAFSIGSVLPSDHKRDGEHDQHLLAKPHAMMTGFLLRSEVVSGWPDLQIDGYDEAVKNENYEHNTRPSAEPIKGELSLEHGAAMTLQKALNEGDSSKVAQKFGFDSGSNIEVSPIVANSSWLVNFNENEIMYLIEKGEEGFRLRIENKLPLLRMSRLSSNVLICIFAGDIRTVDIHQKPEALHFGLNRPEDASKSYYRELKSHIGGELRGCKVDILWKSGQDKRVISIKQFNGAIQSMLKNFPSGELRTVAIKSVGEQVIPTFVAEFKKTADNATSAQFALQVTEGVQKVRFVVANKARPQI